MSRIVAQSYRTLLTACGLLAGLAIAGLAFMITLDVIMRNLGLTNFPWLLEVSEYVLFIVTFGAAPWVLHSGSHVRVDLLVTSLPKRAGLGVELIADLLGFVASALLGWHGLRVAMDTFSRGDLLYKELVIPEWPLLAVIPVSAAMLAIEFTRRIAAALNADEAVPSPNHMSDGM